MIMDPMMTENFITQADVRLIYTSVKKHTITSKHVEILYYVFEIMIFTFITIIASESK